MSTHTPEPWFICTTEPAEIRTHPYGGIVIGETIPNAYNASRAVACVNACAGMADPAAEIQALRDAVKDAREAFEDLMSLLPDVPPWAHTEATLALTKLKSIA